ncbi:TolC family protein [Methylomonas sp. SURF-2]|uniref:TolC family protein n=1 Tax=Methylomonas subterranea TaxID=2952225 RepID=A0ABT1TFB7_9GAMM|nr:TolC family protein [Methylomonas sp. SURF-2]MCQ8104130.1 TolC family protein [Methylomonas sp. SURF-2]
MTVSGHIKICLALTWLAVLPCRADDRLRIPMANPLEPNMADGQKLLVEHLDPVEVDPVLTLPQLLEETLQKYPDRLINEALMQQAEAWQTRGDSWLAGSTALALDYADDRIANDNGSREASANLEFTVWLWGQRDAAQQVAHESQQAAGKHSVAVRLEVAKLLREALWDMALAENRLQQAQIGLDISSQLLGKVGRRVELGDLPRADLLLAESEHLQNKTLLTQAEAEVMHSRKSYASLTQTTRLPANYLEQQSGLQAIQPDHPFLAAINALVAKQQASVEWAKTTDSINQPKVIIGAKTSRGQRGAEDMQSANIGVLIPFGHGTYDAPEIAAANLELNHVLAQREHLTRQLEKGLHEAEHALEVNRAELAIARQLKDIAEQHLKMMQTSFEAGEINLLDLLKVQARSLEAVRNAREQEVKLQRNIALYNQAVGVMP